MKLHLDMLRHLLLTLLSCLAFLSGPLFLNGQTIFAEEIDFDFDFTPNKVLDPPPPLTLQILFTGDLDQVQTTPIYESPANTVVSKGFNSFVGFTPDKTEVSLGWISVHHAIISSNDHIGDGGGTTVFRVKRNINSDELVVMDQTLADGRSGKFFNVDYVNFVGETLANSGGISSTYDGRIWAAEEWFRSGPSSIAEIRDSNDVTISSEIEGWDGQTLSKYQSFNYMVEIDPRQAKAIRKQYNWGRTGYEAGVVANDNRTVYLGVDATPGYFVKFVADQPGDFTAGKLFVYKHDDPDNWVEIESAFEPLLFIQNSFVFAGATMYNRMEGMAYDPETGLVYWAESGRDFPGSRWVSAFNDGTVYDPLHVARANAQGIESPGDSKYQDFYGRVWVYDPSTRKNTVLIEGAQIGIIKFHRLRRLISLNTYPTRMP